MKVNILGTWYGLKIDVPESKDKGLADCDGYCNYQSKKIVTAALDKNGWEDATEQEKDYRRKHCMRHEITHAFMFESGLGFDSMQPSNWATNEEMIDWFAMQSPKIYKVFEKVGCLD